MIIIKQNQRVSFLIIAFLYVLATFLAIFVFRALPGLSLIMRVFAADLAATLFIYLSGLALKNASVYDPYWSVAPVLILTLLAFYLGAIKKGSIILLALIWFWGARLTANWALTFQSLTQQDWRYDMLREKTKKGYPLVSLLGIHLFPTVVVFLCLIPAIEYIKIGEITPITWMGFALCLIATSVELMADHQIHRHKKQYPDRSQILDSGLWRLCRHPNYLGEIMMWWGVYIVQLSVLPGRWYLLAGPLLNTLLFLLISIPMAEKRLSERKPAYKAYREQTPMLLPIRIRKKKQAKANKIS